MARCPYLKKRASCHLERREDEKQKCADPIRVVLSTFAIFSDGKL
jgi:hypothetical protein